MSARARAEAANRILATLPYYANPDRVRADVLRLTEVAPHLNPKEEMYSGPENSYESQKMLTFTGTIEIVVGGRTYHTPIRLHICPSHPTDAPIVYLDPTPDTMRVKRGYSYAKRDGRVDVPYLSAWSSSSGGGRDLAGLVGSLMSLFSAHPPLEAIPRPPPPASVAAHSSTTTQSPPVAARSESENLRAIMEQSRREEEERKRRLEAREAEMLAEVMRKSAEDRSEGRATGGGGSGVVETGVGGRDGAGEVEAAAAVRRTQSVGDPERARVMRGEIMRKMEQEFRTVARDSAELVDKTQAVADRLERDLRKFLERVGEVEGEVDTVEEYERTLDEKIAQVEAFVRAKEAQLDAERALSPDELAARVAPANALSEQLVRVVAEYFSYDDAITALVKAAREFEIKPQDFVALVRKCAERQFRAKILAEKIARSLQSATETTHEGTGTTRDTRPSPTTHRSSTTTPTSSASASSTSTSTTTSSRPAPSISSVSYPSIPSAPTMPTAL